MIDYNKVFTAIKTHCDMLTDGEDCFEHVSKHADVPMEKLLYCLAGLQKLGFIRYSEITRSISLTVAGKMRDKLFM